MRNIKRKIFWEPDALISQQYNQNPQLSDLINLSNHTSIIIPTKLTVEGTHLLTNNKLIYSIGYPVFIV